MIRFAGLVILKCIIMLEVFNTEVLAQRTVSTLSGGVSQIYSPEDGIASYQPENAGLTTDGFLWFSTRAGTVRISPGQIEDYGQAFGVHMMPFSYHDRATGVTWFTDNTELIRHDQYGMKRFRADDGFVVPGTGRSTIIAMHGDRSGRLWIGSYSIPPREPQNGGLLVYEDGIFREIGFDELPFHNISGIFEASDGALWFTSFGYFEDGHFGSQAYIARFDGEAFEVFDSGTTGCRNVLINFMGPSGLGPHMVEDGAGRIWFTCAGSFSPGSDRSDYSGLFVFDDGEFRQVNEISERSPNPALLPTPLFARELDALFAQFSYFGRPGTSVPGFQTDDINRVLHRYSDGEWVPVYLADPDFIKERADAAGFSENSYQNVSILSQPGEPASLSIGGMSENGQIFSHFYIFEDEGFQYVDTFPGWLLLKLPGQSFLTVHNEPDIMGIYTPPRSRLLTEADGLLRNPVNGGQLTTDRDGHVWISFSNQYSAERNEWNDVGINMWDGNRLHAFTSEDGLASNFAYRPYHASDGRLWIPTIRGVTLGQKVGDRYTFRPVPGPGNRPYRVTDMLETDNGTIWSYNVEVRPELNGMEARHSFFGVYKNGRFEEVENPFPDSLKALIQHAYELRKGSGNRVWLYGRFSDNVDIDNRRTFVRVYENGDWFDPADRWNVPAERLYYVGELDGNRYYIINGGFLKFDGERYIDLSDSVNARADYRILKQVDTQNMFFNIEGNGYLYIRLRDRGLVVYDGENLTYLDRRSGLPGARLLYPNRDRNGEMMFTTAVGGAIFNGTDHTFFRDDAMPNSSPNGIGRDKYGNLLILYQNAGITVTRMDTLAYPVRFLQITSDTLNLFSGAQPELPYSQNRIGFRFTSMNYSAGLDTRFRYILDGYHSDWSALTRQNEVQFSDLRPGQYTFRVEAVVPGYATSQEAAYTFRVLKPWWRKWWAYSLYLFMIAGLVFAVDRVQRRRLRTIMREKARERELEQARELQKAYDELAKAHENLKAAQDQLVQQEKLASLGQLTAGIAHEIKNPLNFVNNFSEVSMELIQEAKDELAALNGQADYVKEILDNIESNLAKIREHGTRADRIVRSMLLHSRGGSGKMEPADLNGLIREYVNLSYHGMRAGKDPITSEIEIETDDSIGEVNLIAEDFSRVILNICANSFDAMKSRYVAEKDAGYTPNLTIRTRKGDGVVIVEIEDNGPGIPEEIRDKILQPFFTTKKGTEGTGLGLSITHDIVKAHGGTLGIQSEPGSGTVFTIELPS
jgi:signal transduction histidine kinase